MSNEWRLSSQFLMPGTKRDNGVSTYDIYPTHELGKDKIFKGFDSLVNELVLHKTVLIDGFIGVFFDDFKKQLESFLAKKNRKVHWFDVSVALKSEEDIDEMIDPFLGGNDPLFGTRTTLQLAEFFQSEILVKPELDASADLNIIYGVGAALTGVKGLLVYIDLPKNELQFRARAKAVTNLGATRAAEIKPMYKRYYFVDWPVLNRHKQTILPDLDIMVDGQRPADITWIKGADLRSGLTAISQSIFRIRPWFEPGAWGGSWILNHINGLNKEVPNYAWSFELIVPENGLVFESSGHLLEVSFDCLMFQEGPAVLGEAFAKFGTEFPIRFDFLDTFDGGNLSIQCHPHQEYTKEHFNEDFTQEETYYILDTKDQANVYLGFVDNIDPEEFENEITTSFKTNTPVAIEKFVNKLPAQKHDLFLIPPGTIHGSGINNLVLEISSTPYIFTFKMYDWLRLDLNGEPRPLNIQRGLENLCFERKGAYVKENLVSNPILIDSGNGWQLYHLPTHENHLYDVHRIHLQTEMAINTDHKCHVLSLVEGDSITVISQNGVQQRFSYAETFVIPASAGSYKLINDSGKTSMVVKAFVK